MGDRLAAPSVPDRLATDQAFRSLQDLELRALAAFDDMLRASDSVARAMSSLAGLAPVSVWLSSMLQDALKLMRSARTRHRRKRWPWRVLDHGPGWREAGLGVRYKALRWPGPCPPEWERVGWRLVSHHGYRGEAVRAARALCDVDTVLGS